MKRSVVVVAVMLSGCAHRIAPVEVSAPPVVIVSKAPPEAGPVSDSVAAVEAALNGVTLRFTFDGDLLDENGMASLQRLAPVLRRHLGVRVTIAGNCDERGTEEYNLMLGQRRAEAARKYLLSLGVEERQLETISFGAEHPVNERHDEAAWADNRRDELSVKQQVSMSDELMETLR